MDPGNQNNNWWINIKNKSTKYFSSILNKETPKKIDVEQKPNSIQPSSPSSEFLVNQFNPPKTGSKRKPNFIEKLTSLISGDSNASPTKSLNKKEIFNGINSELFPSDESNPPNFFSNQPKTSKSSTTFGNFNYNGNNKKRFKIQTDKSSPKVPNLSEDLNSKCSFSDENDNESKKEIKNDIKKNLKNNVADISKAKITPQKNKKESPINFKNLNKRVENECKHKVNIEEKLSKSVKTLFGTVPYFLTTFSKRDISKSLLTNNAEELMADTVDTLISHEIGSNHACYKLIEQDESVGVNTKKIMEHIVDQNTIMKHEIKLLKNRIFKNNLAQEDYNPNNDQNVKERINKTELKENTLKKKTDDKDKTTIKTQKNILDLFDNLKSSSSDDDISSDISLNETTPKIGNKETKVKKQKQKKINQNLHSIDLTLQNQNEKKSTSIKKTKQRSITKKKSNNSSGKKPKINSPINIDLTSANNPPKSPKKTENLNLINLFNSKSPQQTTILPKSPQNDQTSTEMKFKQPPIPPKKNETKTKTFDFQSTSFDNKPDQSNTNSLFGTQPINTLNTQKDNKLPNKTNNLLTDSTKLTTTTNKKPSLFETNWGTTTNDFKTPGTTFTTNFKTNVENKTPTNLFQKTNVENKTPTNLFQKTNNDFPKTTNGGLNITNNTNILKNKSGTQESPLFPDMTMKNQDQMTDSNEGYGVTNGITPFEFNGMKQKRSLTQFQNNSSDNPTNVTPTNFNFNSVDNNVNSTSSIFNNKTNQATNGSDKFNNINNFSNRSNMWNKNNQTTNTMFNVDNRLPNKPGGSTTFGSIKPVEEQSKPFNPDLQIDRKLLALGLQTSDTSNRNKRRFFRGRRRLQQRNK